MNFLTPELIKKKRNGLSLTDEEIKWFVHQYTSDHLPDYQMSALLMAIFFKGMNDQETLALTQAMLESGRILSYPHILSQKIDKHSTGGVGDKTSLILGPIVASCGITVPMISGRGLGHTGGTLDKLESIPGFDINLNLDKFTQILQKIGICFIGQTKEICPADKKIYALRDVTATVENLSLICASIMSKKLAEGIDGLVLDVKFGSGAFMKTFEDAKKLAQNLKKIGEGAGKKVVALLTDMNQPLGAYIGNALEVHECVEILQNKTLLNSSGFDLYSDNRELSIELAAYMIWLGGGSKSVEQGRELSMNALKSGRALKKFEEMCLLQKGRLNELPPPLVQHQILSPREGFIKNFKTENIGIAAIRIGAGRAKINDRIEPTAGLMIHHKIGHFVKANEPLFSLYGKDAENIKKIEKDLLDSIEWSQNPPLINPLIAQVMV